MGNPTIQDPNRGKYDCANYQVFRREQRHHVEHIAMFIRIPLGRRNTQHFQITENKIIKEK